MQPIDHDYSTSRNADDSGYTARFTSPTSIPESAPALGNWDKGAEIVGRTTLHAVGISRSSKRTKSIILLGGAGEVGRHLVTRLLEQNGWLITLAGRNGRATKQAARRFASDRVQWMRMDVFDEKVVDELTGFDVVVNLVDRAPGELAKTVVESGHIYLDVSATTEHLSQIEQILEKGPYPGLAVLSVGLAPGLTNIMAREILSASDTIVSLDICLVLDALAQHGEDASGWFFANFSRPYPVAAAGKVLQAHAGAFKRQFDLSEGDETKSYDSFSFGFSDQYSIAKSSDLCTVRTFVSLHPPLVGGLVSLFVSTRIGRRVLSKSRPILDLVPNRTGKNLTINKVLVEAMSEDQSIEQTLGVTLGGQSEATACLIAATIIAADQSTQTGCIHSDQLLSFDMALEALENAKIHFSLFGQHSHEEEMSNDFG